MELAGDGMDIDFGSSLDLQDSSTADALFGVDKENDQPDAGEGGSSRRSSIIPNFVSNLAKRATDRRSSAKCSSRTSAAAASSPRRLKRSRREMSTTESLTDCTFTSIDSSEANHRKRSALDRVQSITSLPGRKVNQPSDKSPAKKARVPVKGYQPPTPQKARPKVQQLWSNTVQSGDDALDEASVLRQEAIYEMFTHASSMLSDAKTVLDNYAKPMDKLRILSEEESKQLFGQLYKFPDVHQCIVDQMARQRDTATGKTECIGKTLTETLPRLKVLIPFCSKLQLARDVYDAKLQDQSVKDFLDRCRTCAFSNRRSLWDLLDSQRSSLIKYPLLLKQLIKVTPKDHSDLDDLRDVLKIMQDLAAEMDQKTGEVKCQQALSRLQYTGTTRCPIVDASRQLLCSGPLKLTVRNSMVEVSSVRACVCACVCVCVCVCVCACVHVHGSVMIGTETF